MKNLIEITGQRFGRLTVIKREKKRSSSGNAAWLCRCTCGNLKVVDSYLLRHNKVLSCGCLRREQARQQFQQNPAMIQNMGNTAGLRDNYGNPLQMVTMNRRNKSGVIGVSFDETTQRWVARMMVRGKYVLNATFKEFDEAVEVRREFERKYLKHPT